MKVTVKKGNVLPMMMMMKETQVPVEQEAGWTPESDWTLFIRGQSNVSE
jgi:hypothetical protein